MPRNCGIFFINPDNKNQLLKVNDLNPSPQGFNQANDVASGDVDANNVDHTEDYTYDFNGNMKSDTNKGVEDITYNHLNLPIKINFGAKGNIYYLYNAIGGKVKKVVEDNVAHITTTTDYLSGFQYLNTTLQFFPHAEGYVHYTRPLSNSQLGSFNYVFNYTDHLGNVRVSFANDPLQGNVLKILEENHYYAFGMKHENYNVTRLNFKYYPETGVELVPLPAVANASYNVKFNGKELQEELVLNMTAMDWRLYDSAIGRFIGMDLLSESSSSLTPYHFGYNNPNFWSDPSGLLSQGAIDAMWNGTAENGRSTWTNNGAGFSRGTSKYIDYEGFETIEPILVSGTYNKGSGRFTYDSDAMVGGFKYGLAEKIRDHVFARGSAYQSRRDAFASRQWDDLQSGLDYAGSIPVIGEPIDFINGVISVARGNYGTAALSFGAMIPLAGNFATGAKYLGKIDDYAKLADDLGTRAYIKEFNNTSVVNTRILFNDITQGGTKKIINTPNGNIIKATMQDGSMIQLRNFSTKSGDLNHSTIQFIGSQEKWKFNH